VSRARGEFFMWAAHDDWRDPSYIKRCLGALDAEPKAVLAVTDVRLIQPNRESSHLFTYSRDVSEPDPVRRLRSILRGGGWFAIYGLIRRAALAKTRSIGSLEPTPAPGLGPDYRVVELVLMGPFVRVAEPLLEYQLRDPESAEVLGRRLDPRARFRGTMFWWWMRDLWRMTGRYGFNFKLRLGIQTEYLASARAPGSLHTVLLLYNSEFLAAAQRGRRWASITNLLLERCMIDGLRSAITKEREEMA